jgi:15,16-dihydrobiliverdin:ferredoxin oxidoreductase
MNTFTLAMIVIGFCLSCTSAYHFSSSTGSSFAGMARQHQHFHPASSTASASILTMDVETPNTQESRFLRRWDDSPFLRRTTTGLSAVNQAATTHGMPWKTSVDPSYTEEHQRRRRNQNAHDVASSSCLPYTPFWEWQLAYMKEHLTNLRPLPVIDWNGNDMSYAESQRSRGGMLRMHTVQFASDEYRLIRMTTVDGGHQTQVYTSVWYPDLKYNMPILGIDLLQFGCAGGDHSGDSGGSSKNANNANTSKRTVCIMDFQSLHDREEDHDFAYEHLLSPIRQLFPSLQGEISNRFYSKEFFSKQTLLGRCHDNDNKANHGENEDDKPQLQQQQHEALVYDEMLPAFQQYMQTHVSLIKDASAAAAVRARQCPTGTMARVLQRHREYDVHSSARDPAKGLLAHHFGKDFAHSFVHDILFPLSRRSSERYTLSPRTEKKHDAFQAHVSDRGRENAQGQFVERKCTR